MQRPFKSKMTGGLVYTLLSVLGVVLISGCSPASNQMNLKGLDLAPVSSMPDYVRDAPVSVQQAYQFAVANPDFLAQIPCYCGCREVGHTSNYECYVSGQNPDGSLSFDPHALGCSICVDITQDSMRLMTRGRTVNQIRDFIDGTYSKYDPSNLP